MPYKPNQHLCQPQRPQLQQKPQKPPERHQENADIVNGHMKWHQAMNDPVGHSHADKQD